MDKKIVFFDIDGTIYKYNKGIPEDTKVAIKQLKENGHIPVICTGRTRCMIFEEHLKLGFTNIIGGAGTYIEKDGEEIFLAEMKKPEVKRVIDGFIECNFLPVAEGRDNIYLGTDYSNLSYNNKLFIDVYNEKIPDKIMTIYEPDMHISKISGVFKTNSDMNKMIEMFKDQYSIVNHNYNLLELVMKGYNKALGIKKMITEINIPWENTYAFGDSLNDIDMLEYVKYGCAMGNSDSKIKERVNYITDDYDKGGISNALKKFGLI